jgi:hypothetical protein
MTIIPGELTPPGMCWYWYWCMVYGVWCMVYGVWCMVYGVGEAQLLLLA